MLLVKGRLQTLSNFSMKHLSCGPKDAPKLELPRRHVPSISISHMYYQKPSEIMRMNFLFLLLMRSPRRVCDPNVCPFIVFFTVSPPHQVLAGVYTMKVAIVAHGPLWMPLKSAGSLFNRSTMSVIRFLHLLHTSFRQRSLDSLFHLNTYLEVVPANPRSRMTLASTIL